MRNPIRIGAIEIIENPRKISKAQSHKTLIDNADRWFSRYIRLRDSVGSDCARCVTCGAIKRHAQMQCGHWQKRNKLAVRYHHQNAHAQCPRCNDYGKGEETLHAQHIIRAYGEAVHTELITLGGMLCKLDKYYLHDIAHTFRVGANHFVQNGKNKWW